MRRANILPNSVTVTTLLTGCFERGNATAARAVATYFEKIADEIEAEYADAVSRKRYVKKASLLGLSAQSIRSPGSVATSVSALGEQGEVASGDGTAMAIESAIATPAAELKSVHGNSSTTAPRDSMKHRVRPHGRHGAAKLRHAVACAMIVGLCKPVVSPFAAGGSGSLVTAAVGGDGSGAPRPRARERAMVLEAAKRFFKLCETRSDSSSSEDVGTKWSSHGPFIRWRHELTVPVRTCNALLAALVGIGETSIASRALYAMDSSSAAESPNAYSLSIMLAAHGRAKQLRPAAAMWGRLQAAGWVDSVALNSWIGACANNGQLRLALQAFQVCYSTPALGNLLACPCLSVLNGRNG